MSRAFYNATPAGNGCGCGFSFNSVDQAIYVSFVKQSAWDASSRSGVFKGEKCNIKLSIEEAGGIIGAIESEEKFSAYHDATKGDYESAQKTGISFMPFIAKDKEGNERTKFGFSINKNEGGKKSDFKVSFERGAAIIVREYLLFAIKHLNDANYAEEKKFRIEAKKRRDLEASAPQAPAKDDSAF